MIHYDILLIILSSPLLFFLSSSHLLFPIDNQNRNWILKNNNNINTHTHTRPPIKCKVLVSTTLRLDLWYGRFRLLLRRHDCHPGAELVGSVALLDLEEMTRQLLEIDRFDVGPFVLPLLHAPVHPQNNNNN